MMSETLTKNAIILLKDLIKIKSFSGYEDKSADKIEEWLSYNKIKFSRKHNNIWAYNNYYDKNKPTMMLNSHHDTVKPNSAYSLDPYLPQEKDGKIYGLGSNDAGGSLVSLLALFNYFYNKKNMKYNLLIVVSAEEEISGKKGIFSLLPLLPKIEFAIIGEPTQMNMAIAEAGLIVFDGIIYGTSSHVAHRNDNNAIMKIPEILNWFNEFKFKRKSKYLGPVKMVVTNINAGDNHNVIPASVKLVVDVRVNEKYTNHEISEILLKEAPCELKARSLRLSSSYIDPNHKLIKYGRKIRRKTYGSNTLSDRTLLNFPSVKIGPGNSKRSHTADEYIYVKDIQEGIKIYMKLLNHFLK